MIDVPPACGFAVFHRGRIVVETVSPTERAAKVNGLVVLFGMAVMNRDTDEQIERAWKLIEHRHPGARIVSVEVVAK